MADLLELIVPIHTNDPNAPVVQAVVQALASYVQGGAVVEATGFGDYGEAEDVRVVVRGYLPVAHANGALLHEIRRRLLLLPEADRVGELRVLTLREEDWAEAWKKHYHPLRVGQRLLISPTWEQPETDADDVVIWLDPGMAFGTGLHPSTRLILRLLERHLRPNDRVLDVGTGSGILAIAALKLGATHVHATDIDPVAVETARQNLACNRVGDRCTLEVGSVPAEGEFRIVCANILADVLADLLLHEDLGARVAPGGLLLLSGIIEYRRHILDLALAARGWSAIDQEREGEWLAFAARKNPVSRERESSSSLQSPADL
ncbi:MAG: 50S ribosomal protein L11 methyltransferase [Caldilineae bacterium]|nr:MAG: 50S ribosomal protein L11 methyltransferase [Caldilineae bacterium]